MDWIIFASLSLFGLFAWIKYRDRDYLFLLLLNSAGLLINILKELKLVSSNIAHYFWLIFLILLAAISIKIIAMRKSKLPD